MQVEFSDILAPAVFGAAFLLASLYSGWLLRRIDKAGRRSTPESPPSTGVRPAE